MPSIFDRLFGNKLYFIDSEVSVNDGTVVDLAAVRDKDEGFIHTASQNEFATVVRALAAWSPKDDEKEYPQILAYVYMRKGR